MPNFIEANNLGNKIKKFVLSNAELFRDRDVKEIYRAIRGEPNVMISAVLYLLEECGVDVCDALGQMPHYFYYFNDIVENIKISPYTPNISNSAFQFCDNLKKVWIPSSVRDIGFEAFSSCHKLETVTFEPDSECIAIYDEAFYDCRSLTSIHLPPKVTDIGAHTFAYCTNLSYVVLPGTDLYIGSGAFADTPVTKLIYPGPRDKFDDWNFSKSWKDGSDIQKVVCTDGEVFI